MGLELLFFAVALAALTIWHLREWTYERAKPKESPVLDRKARFALYVQGEQQLMADWEAAFEPDKAERERHATLFIYDTWQRQRQVKHMVDTAMIHPPGGVTQTPMGYQMQPGMPPQDPMMQQYSNNPYLTIGEYMQGPQA